MDLKKGGGLLKKPGGTAEKSHQVPQETNKPTPSFKKTGQTALSGAYKDVAKLDTGTPKIPIQRYSRESTFNDSSAGQNRNKLFLAIAVVAGMILFFVIYNLDDRPVSDDSRALAERETKNPAAPSSQPAPETESPSRALTGGSGTGNAPAPSLNTYMSRYQRSSVDYASTYPEEFSMLYEMLKDVFSREELAAIVNKDAAELDSAHKEKMRFVAAPNSLKKQKQQHKDYIPILVNDKTVQEGLSFFNEYRDTLKRAMNTTGVKIEDIIAVINWESKFGKYRGEYSVFKVFVGNLFHLSEIEEQLYQEGAYDKENVMSREKALPRIQKLKKRAAENLAALLRLSREKSFNPYEIKGSWAGAIGIPQFMPASMVYAADGSGDGEIDLNNMDDAIFSIANFLKEHEYNTKGTKFALARYNPEKMYVEGVSLYSQKILDAGLTY